MKEALQYLDTIEIHVPYFYFDNDGGSDSPSATDYLHNLQFDFHMTLRSVSIDCYLAL